MPTDERKRNIEKTLDRMLVVPLILEAVLNTFSPHVLKIGGFTTVVITSSSALIGVLLVYEGANINFKVVPKALKKAAVITLTKFMFIVIFWLLIAKLFGNKGVFGLYSLAVIAAVTNNIDGLFATLAREFGDENYVSSIAVLSLNNAPFLTLVALGKAGIATTPLNSFIDILILIIFGMILGNSDRTMRNFLVLGGLILIPFFAFALETGIDIKVLVIISSSELLLSVITTFNGGSLNILADRKSGGSEIAGAAASSSGGNAMTTPTAIALSDPNFAILSATATPQVATSTITTAILTSMVTAYIRISNLSSDKSIQIQ